MHKHHIIPRHMGGTDDPSNILKCNIAMHAFLHKQLWEEWGCYQDKVAWHMLSGQINSAEATRQIQSKTASETNKRLASDRMKKRWQDPEWRKKMQNANYSDRAGKNNSFYGKTHSEETRQRFGSTLSKNQKGQRWINNGSQNKIIRRNISLPEGWLFGRLPYKK